MQTDLKKAIFFMMCVCAGFTATVAKADCQGDFRSMMTAHLKAGAYHVSSVGGVTTYNLESNGPDEFYMVEFGAENADVPTGELIFTSKGGWSKQGGGSWKPIPDAAVKMAVAGLNGGLAGGFQGAKVATCKDYQSPKELPNGRKGTAYFDFKAEVFDMHQGNVSAEIGLIKGDEGLPAALLVRTGRGDETQLITYDANIRIEPPQP